MEDYRPFSFESLDVYKEARLLVKEVYLLQEKFPVHERFALGDQIRRSSSSITSNIAEGSGRTSYKEKLSFLSIAFGSLTECFSQLQIAQDLNYIEESDLYRLRPLFNRVAALLSGLRNSYKRFLEKESVQQPRSYPLTHNR